MVLTGILVILALSVARYASEIVLPIVLAFVLKLVLAPLLRNLEKVRLPRPLASGLIAFMLVGGLWALGTLISAPATTWLDKLPDSLPKLQQRLDGFSDSLDHAQKVVDQAEKLTTAGDEKIVQVAVQGTRLSDKLFSGASAFASGLFTTMLVLFFLLMAGDTFLRRIVETLPRFSDKRQAVDIVQQIEQDISAYLLTITVMNALVGIGAGIIAVTTGLGDALLWGTLAFALNYIPFLGPVCCAGLLLLAGLLNNAALPMAFLPAGLFLLTHFAEGTLITPMLLAKRFTLNPVLVILSLIFWYWMWGFAGAILAVPLLAIAKIICDRIDRLKPFGHFLEG